MVRKGDRTHRTHFRTDRFFKVDDQGWFFATREEGDKGPYPTREAARRALAHWLQTGAHNPPGEPWELPGTDR